METSWTSKQTSLDPVSYSIFRFWLKWNLLYLKTFKNNLTVKIEIRTSLIWFAVVEDTPFHGGIFRCKLVLDSDFPNKPPKGYFLTKIFHPNVATPSGDICVNTLKRDWNPQNWSLSHIFQTIKCLLIVPFPESALNEEAGRLFMESYDEYFAQAKLYTSIHAKPNGK